jgi:hypothetical protein
MSSRLSKGGMLYLVMFKIRETGTVCSRRCLRTRQIQSRMLKPGMVLTPQEFPTLAFPAGLTVPS